MSARHSITDRRFVRAGIISLSLAAGLTTSAHAQILDASVPETAPQYVEWVTVPYEDMELSFIAEDLDAPSVWAMPDGDPSRTPSRLLSEVVVRTTDANALRLAIAAIDADILSGADRRAVVDTFPATPKFMVVRTSSVRHAVSVLNGLRGWPDLSEAFLNIDAPKVARGGGVPPTDPLFATQWYVDNTNPGNLLQSANILNAWDVATGEGVVVGLLDRGEFNFDSPVFNDTITAVAQFHTDIENSVSAEFSQPSAQNPFPTLAANPQYQHALALAAIIGAEANNGVGIAGVAYDAQLAALRNGGLLQTGEAIAFGNDDIDIKVHTWGFNDAGEAGFPFNRVGTGSIAFDFLIDSVETSIINGRGGLGTIHVSAAGNGGNFFNPDAATWYLDGEGRADLDVFTSSRFTIAVGAAAENTATLATVLPSYASAGSSILVAAPAANPGAGAGRGFNVPGINSATLAEEYGIISDFGRGVAPPPGEVSNPYEGTSVSAAIAGGVIALMLEANPSLTWRDVQHILVDTANPFATGFIGIRSFIPTNGLPSRFVDPVGANFNRVTWQINGGGRPTSDGFGFGMIDAAAAVDAALSWENVPDAVVLETQVLNLEFEVAPPANILDTTTMPETLIDVVEAVPTPSPEICVPNSVLVEHVEIEVTVGGGPANGLEIWLNSPSGTQSILKNGVSTLDPLTEPALIAGAETAGDFRFTSVRHWGEPAGGPWQLSVQDEISEPCCDLTCIDDGWCDAEYTLQSMRLRIFGIDTGRPNFPCPFVSLSCGGDLNSDGFVTIQDLLIFLALWEQGDLQADANEDGQVDYADFIFFYTQIWFPQLGGCASVVDFNGIPLGDGGSLPIGPPNFDG